MGRTNRADSGTHAVQVGKVVPVSDADRAARQTAREATRQAAQRGSAGSTTTNVRSGNATVGAQHDEITGGLSF